MTRAKKLIHIHSNVYAQGQPKAPDSGVLEKGEIAVNYNDTEPALFIENNSGEIVKFNAISKDQVDSIEETLSAETFVRSVVDAELQNDVNALSSAQTQMSSAITNVENSVSAISSSVTELQEAISALTIIDGGYYVGAQTPLFTFAGLNIAPAPLYYGANGFEIKDDDWNHDSYNSLKGKVEGSYFFNFVELGSYFDADGDSFSTSSGDIDNTNKISYRGYDDWRVPTRNEWLAITNTTRQGSNVNGTSGAMYSYIKLTGVTHAGSSEPGGLLLFPDGKDITGKTLTRVNRDSSTGVTSGVTDSELQTYLDQGCIFLPTSGYAYNNSWMGNSSGDYWSATQYNSTNGYFLGISKSGVKSVSYDGKAGEYGTVRLVRTANAQ